MIVSGTWRVMDVGSLPKKVWAVSRDAAHYKQWDSISKTQLTATLRLTLEGASSSVGSALRSYAKRRGFEGSTLFDCFVRSRPIEHIVRFNARARASSRVSQVSSNFIPDAGYNTYVRLGLSTVIGFSSDAACTRRASLPTSG